MAFHIKRAISITTFIVFIASCSSIDPRLIPTYQQQPSVTQWYTELGEVSGCRFVFKNKFGWPTGEFTVSEKRGFKNLALPIDGCGDEKSNIKQNYQYQYIEGRTGMKIVQIIEDGFDQNYCRKKQFTDGVITEERRYFASERANTCDQENLEEYLLINHTYSHGDGRLKNIVFKNGTGMDEEWATLDDDIYQITSVRWVDFSNGGSASIEQTILSAGKDAAWETFDDEFSSNYLVKKYDENGVLYKSAIYQIDPKLGYERFKNPKPNEDEIVLSCLFDFRDKESSAMCYDHPGEDGQWDTSSDNRLRMLMVY